MLAPLVWAFLVCDCGCGSPWTRQESSTPSFCAMDTKRKNMGIIKLFTKKRFGIDAKIREEAMVVFERDVEKCTLVGNSILDRFQVEAAISNTKRRLQEKPLQQKGDLSESQYYKIIDAVAVEVKRRYVE